MKIKLKKGECLESHSSHQGFPSSILSKLNAGKTVEFDRIPNRCKDKIETVSASSNSSPSTSQSPPSSSSSSSGSKKTGGK